MPDCIFKGGNGYMAKTRDFYNLDPSQWIEKFSTSKRVAEVRTFLMEQGTFRFPRLSNGLFPAASGIGSDFEATGYRNVWVRDNVHVAYAHWLTGETEVAVRCIQAIAEFLYRHRHRFENIIHGTVEPADPMNRPHIRFRGDDLTELPEKWAHAQNDALGYFLWLYSTLIASCREHMRHIHWELIALLIHYFETIEFWKDEDSGHWEESRKVSASSIGTVTKALHRLTIDLQQSFPEGVKILRDGSYPITIEQLTKLHLLGENALLNIVPWECNSELPQQQRKHDAALVFLCYPLGVLRTQESDKVLLNIEQHLLGPIGIRRYLGDSYWCANYKKLFSPDQRSIDFSDDISARNRLMQPGSEAQWCIFDPAISCFYGWRYHKQYANGRVADDIAFQKQVHYLQRSLAQLTKAKDACGPFRCPESYYLQDESWVPNDLTPLLWTQANLLQAIWWMERSMKLREA
jgi:Glycosyl hydrolases family 15